MISEKRNTAFEKFRSVRTAILGTGISKMYLYGSEALKRRVEKFKNYNIPVFHAEYEPNPYNYQYDLELYIFINYEQLKKEEIEIRSSFNEDVSLIEKYGATFLTKEQHLANAASIRWPSKVSPNGVFVGDFAIHQWTMDFFYGLANHKNIIEFGGGGQGKTYAPLAFMCMIYDYFAFTKQGAQCTFSTVSKDKLTGSTWKYLSTLYGTKNNSRYEFSLTAQRAQRGGDFEYRRINNDGKQHIEGGIIKGVLLQKNVHDSRVADKLTGYHSPEARIYLLDEGQSTDDAPLEAYNNMFLHPKYGWFIMSGNYSEEGDLLDRNSEPNLGWDSVDETTHMWKGTLKTKRESLDQESLVIHYNNDLSPAMKDSGIAKLYGRFLPTPEKKRKQYPSEESKKTVGYKRFWVGFRFQNTSESTEYLLTSNIVSSFLCHEKPPSDFIKEFSVGSFDSAPASIDRNVFNVVHVGLCSDGFPMVVPGRIYTFDKPTSELRYYKETCNNIIKAKDANQIPPNAIITDWSGRTALVEMLLELGVTCYPLSYQEKLVEKPTINEKTGIMEDAIPLEKIKSWINPRFEKQVTHYAHEKIANKISLGAYIMRMFFEKGRVRGFNNSILNGTKNSHTFEKEFFRRKFIKKKRAKYGEVMMLDSKDEFIETNGFSPDILDTYFQAFYLIYVFFKISPTKRGLGLYRRKTNKPVDKKTKLWDNMCFGL